MSKKSSKLDESCVKLIMKNQSIYDCWEEFAFSKKWDC